MFTQHKMNLDCEKEVELSDNIDDLIDFKVLKILRNNKIFRLCPYHYDRDNEDRLRQSTYCGFFNFILEINFMCF